MGYTNETWSMEASDWMDICLSQHRSVQSALIEDRLNVCV